MIVLMTRRSTKILQDTYTATVKVPLTKKAEIDNQKERKISIRT